MSQDVVATQLRSMPLCGADETGEAVIFTFQDVGGNLHTFAIHQIAIGEVVMKLTAASEQAARVRGEKRGETRQVRALIPTKTEVGVSEDGTRVSISIYPVQSTPIRFALSPSHSQELANSIQQAVAECAGNQRKGMI